MTVISSIRKKLFQVNASLKLMFRQRFELIFIGAIVLVTRWNTLTQPLVERHDFRQTQTAFTTLTMANGDGGLFNSELPLFGSPWQLPFEFPLFQYIASVLYRIFDLNIDFANRLTSLIFFVLCLLPLHTLASRFMSRTSTVMTCLVFSFSPFAIQWSRASLIEYCALFFGLSFIVYLLKFWDSQRPVNFVMALVAGSVCGLVKVTTLIPMILFVGVLLVTDKTLFQFSRKNVTRLIGISLPVVLTLAVAQVWTIYSDNIRGSNPASQWLTQAQLTSWTYGPLSQRLFKENWLVIFNRVDQLLLPHYSLILLFVVGLVFPKSRRMTCAVGIACLVTISIFFNLYFVHDYYLIALTAFFSLLIGISFEGVVTLLPRGPKTTLLSMLVFLLLLGYSVENGHSYWASAYTKYPRGDSELGKLSSPDQQAFVSWGGWNPLVLYYANRKGMMLTPQAVTLDYLRSLPDLEKYDFYAGNPDWPDVMTMRGWYTPIGQYLTRIDNKPEDMREFGLAFSTLPVDDSNKFENVKTLQCAGVDSLDLRKIPVGTTIKISSTGSNYFSVSQNLQSVPVGKSMKIFSEIPSNNSANLVCGGGGVIDLEW